MRLYSPEFAADPHRAYDEMRRSVGQLVPVEVTAGVPATLVLGYRAALRILADPAHFPADPSTWQATIPAHCPALPIMEWGPVNSDEASEYRHRSTYLAVMNEIDLYQLRAVVEYEAVSLINEFCGTGGADLLSEYAIPLTVQVVNVLLGLPDDTGWQLYDILTALRASTDAVSSRPLDTGFHDLLSSIVSDKRSQPGTDIISRLIQHPSGLDDEEVVAQTAVIYLRGTETTWNLIVNALLLATTDGQFRSGFLSGSLSVREAIDEAVFLDPPLANGCARYPRQPQSVEGEWLAVDQPVLISLTACNSDAARSGDRQGNRSHLAWGAGPRCCPAQSVAAVIVQESLDQLFDALPDITLAVPKEQMSWQANAFHRSPVAMPVQFPPSSSMPLPHRTAPR